MVTVEKPAGLIATLPLVALAGCVDAIGWLRLNGLFVSFMSGTTTMLGASAGGGHRVETWALATAVGLFVVGTVVGFRLARRAAAWRTAAVLLFVGSLLALAWWLPFVGVLPPAACCLVMAMGALNAALPGVGGITFVTGALTRLGEALAAGSPAAWRHLGIWSAMAAGATGGALLQRYAPAAALAVPATIALSGAMLATLLTFKKKRRFQGVSAP